MPVLTVVNHFNFLRSLFLALAILFFIDAHSQLCIGSFGDPVVNITFGSGATGNVSGYAPDNSYIYTSLSCPNDGYYTITDFTSNCFNNSWHTVATDHTG
ncbi:MAG: hypothetical protein JJE22_18075, partial [Bacteroidia bacterium]|nr:hypothetical protein [Bacteroidia bacterium]